MPGRPLCPRLESGSGSPMRTPLQPNGPRTAQVAEATAAPSGALSSTGRNPQAAPWRRKPRTHRGCRPHGGEAASAAVEHSRSRSLERFRGGSPNRRNAVLSRRTRAGHLTRPRLRSDRVPRLPPAPHPPFGLLLGQASRPAQTRIGDAWPKGVARAAPLFGAGVVCFLTYGSGPFATVLGVPSLAVPADIACPFLPADAVRSPDIAAPPNSGGNRHRA